MAWYRSAPQGTSSHAFGAAFDINIRTHYVRYENEIGWLGTWKDEVSSEYAPDVIEALASLLSEFTEAGLCNSVIENEVDESGYSPTCFHVCAAPGIADSL